jgi:hypothetical protein
MRPKTFRGPLAALGATLASLAQAACGAGITQATRTPAPACPAHAPANPAQSSAALSSPRPGRSGPALIPPGAMVVSICQYARPLPPSKARLTSARRIVLRGTPAIGLAAIINGGPPVTGRARRCDRPRGRLPFSQALVFADRSGHRVTAAISYTDCSLAVVAAGSRTAMLAGPLQPDLLYLTSVTRHRRGPRTPDLAGLGIRAAAAAAVRERWSLYVDGAAIDRAVQPGTVIFQTLPAGVPNAGPGKDINVVLAVQPAPACTVGQLALSYLGGGAGAGNDFGSVVVRDDSPRPCTLTGPLHLAGTDKAGRPVTQQVTFPVAGVAVLSPATGPVSQRITVGGSPQSAARGAFVAGLALAAEYRDGPASVDHGYCEPLWLIPAAWRVTLPHGQALTVANADRYNPVGFGGSSGGLVTCRGELGGTRPATVIWQPGATG